MDLDISTRVIETQIRSGGIKGIKNSCWNAETAWNDYCGRLRERDIPPLSQ